MTAGARQAALLLHAIAPRDQEWMLDKLQVSDRKHLEGLLQELKSLGITPEVDLVEQATCGSQSVTQSKNLQASSVTINSIDEATKLLINALPEDVAQVIRKEPLALMAKFLHAYNWPWHKSVLPKLGAICQRNIEDALLSVTGCPPALAKALIMHVAKEVAQMRIMKKQSEAPRPVKDTKLEKRPVTILKKLFGVRIKSALRSY